MFILSSWLRKLQDTVEDLLDECDFEVYIIDLNVFRDALMEIEFNKRLLRYMIRLFK
jgi:hypothetical protein